jgi:hypothetical protein
MFENEQLSGRACGQRALAAGSDVARLLRRTALEAGE